MISEEKCAVSGKKCYYWRGISGTQSEGLHCCHYLLDEGHMRKRGKRGKCLSHREPDPKRKPKHWEYPETPDETILCGYKRHWRDEV